MRNLDYFKCLCSLKEKGVKVDHELKILDLSYSSGIGNSSWGMIDFLCKKHGFTIAGEPNVASTKVNKVFGSI